VSRRRALAAGAAVAAGAAGFALGRAAVTTTGPPAGGAAQSPPRTPSRDLTVLRGQWFPVARLSAVPPGTVVAFTAGAVLGHLVNEGGTLTALSAACTHMGCLLQWQEARREFHCPCHDAIFGPDGVIRPTPEYPYSPPPLPRLQVKVEADEVLVWSTPVDGQPVDAGDAAGASSLPLPPSADW
jgi:Rieske Fe-S protein